MIESMHPDDGEPRVGHQEYAAFNLRKLLPSEILNRPAMKFPKHVAIVLDISEPTLRKMRTNGDAPRLYGVGRFLYTTADDLLEWVRSHEIEPTHRMRRAGPGRPPNRDKGD